MGWLDKPKMLIVGMEAIKSSTPKMTKFLQRNILEMILTKKSQEEIKQYLLDEAMKIYQDKYKATEIGIPSAFNQDEYANNLPRVRGQKWSNKYLDMNIRSGDKPLMLYVTSKNNETDAVCFEYDYQFDEACKLGIKIDKERMIERNIIMPMRTIFEAAGWDLNKAKTEIFMKLNGQRTLI